MARVFVFESNDSGIHGAGAARFAMQYKGAMYGKCYGHYGNSFAIPTKDVDIETLPLERIQMYVQGFLAFAIGHRHMEFQITCIGCGLAGLKHEDVAPMFLGAPKNCMFDELWKPILGDAVRYWGTFP